MKKTGLLLLMCVVLTQCTKVPAPALRYESALGALETSQTVFIGKKVALEFLTSNPEAICGLKLVLTQNDKTSEILNTDSFILKTSANSPDLVAAGFTEGPASLRLETSACSFWKRGNTTDWKAEIDFSPPQVGISSSQHYINQGGANVVRYTVSPDTTLSGVQIGPYFFKGYSVPGTNPESRDRFAFFVFSYELPADTKISVIASDLAGNTSKAGLIPAKFFPKEFRKRDLPIEDSFIETKVSDIIANTPTLKNTGDNLKNFLLVNRELRKKNAADLVEISKKSAETFYWKDAFLPLINSAVEAGFADYRSYIYNGEKVDEQVHLGFDLAALAHYPIKSAGNGKVLFSDYLGIYGNTVIIDHGFGLITLYGHLSQLGVQVGDSITKGQVIGNSGVTGLAGGDHLHFSMLIGGVQTNPIEFWDQKWIQDQVYLRLDSGLFGKQ